MKSFNQLAHIMPLLLALCFGGAACGSSVKSTLGGEAAIESEQLTYRYSINNCDTGEHSFDSVDHLCEGLENTQLNHGCAEYMRENVFAQTCKGKVWKPF